MVATTQWFTPPSSLDGSFLASEGYFGSFLPAVEASHFLLFYLINQDRTTLGNVIRPPRRKKIIRIKIIAKTMGS